MATIAETAMTSSELATLWMMYEIKSCMSKICDAFVAHGKDGRAKRIIEYHSKQNEVFLEGIRGIFNKDKTIIPVAFDARDIFCNAPPLFDDMFKIMFLRILMKISMTSYAMQLGMSYRNDIRKIFKSAIKEAEDVYGICTDYLMKHGVLSKPPYVTMPKEVEFIEEKKYMSGMQLFSNKRALNSMEVAYIYQTLEVNVMGMQLMTGFAQTAKESEVKNYFVTGKELAKKIVSDFSSVLLESDIQPPTTWAGKATDSTVPVFTDKLMMFCTNILASSAIGNNALGMAFSMRSDLPLKLAIVSKDTLDFAREGGKIMIRHKWLEEPPQMEDRNQLIKAKKSLLPI